MTVFETTRRHLYLAGFMGTGKSAIGQQIADLLHRPFLDLDAMIVALHHKTTGEIFASEGEAAFRLIESRALRLVVIAPGSVIALGGGTLISNHNRAVIRGTGHTVLLTAEWNAIWDRVRHSADRRPLLEASSFPIRSESDFVAHAAPLLEKRASGYEALAEFRVNTTDLSIEKSAEVIRDWYIGLYK